MVAAYVLVQSDHHVVNFSTWYFGVYKTAHRIWLRILLTALEKAKGPWLCFTTTLSWLSLLWLFSFVSTFLTSLIKLILWLKLSTDKRQAEDVVGGARTIGSCSGSLLVSFLWRTLINRYQLLTPGTTMICNSTQIWSNKLSLTFLRKKKISTFISNPFTIHWDSTVQHIINQSDTLTWLHWLFSFTFSKFQH